MGGGGGGGSSGGVLGVVTLSGHVQSPPLPPHPQNKLLHQYQIINSSLYNVI